MPEEPVISLTSKHIFEKRLLEKYISENGTDPINGEPLSDEQVRGEKSLEFLRVPFLSSLGFLMN